MSVRKHSLERISNKLGVDFFHHMVAGACDGSLLGMCPSCGGHVYWFLPQTLAHREVHVIRGAAH